MEKKPKPSYPATERKCPRLMDTLKHRRTLLIVMQDFPDPDAIAAAAALRELVRQIGEATVTLACGGFVGRAENRALLKYLGLNIQPLTQALDAEYDGVAMVDTQPGAGNNAWGTERVPDLVIDHHPIRPETRRAPFFDIRRRYGATSTILYEYLVCRGLAIPVPLATALLYGIRSDTADFGREATDADIRAFLALYPSSNKRMLGRIAMARVPRAYFREMAKALNGAKSSGDCVFTDMGDVSNPDIVPEVADLLLRDEETHWAMCLGMYRDRLLVSMRTSDPAKDAGRLMHRLVGRHGTGGGHTGMAGGQIPLAATHPDNRQAVADAFVKRFLKAMNARSADMRSLIEDAAGPAPEAAGAYPGLPPNPGVKVPRATG